VCCWELYQQANICSWTAVLQVFAVDENLEAVAWAKLNVQRLGLTDRIQVSITTAHSTQKLVLLNEAQHTRPKDHRAATFFLLICTTLLHLALQGNALSSSTRRFAQSIDQMISHQRGG
jgi:hypothetical protein